MSLTVERAAEATPEVHDLIGELNAVLGAVYETHQRHGLAIEQLFEPNVRFFVARFVVGCGHPCAETPTTHQGFKRIRSSASLQSGGFAGANAQVLPWHRVCQWRCVRPSHNLANGPLRGL